MSITVVTKDLVRVLDIATRASTPKSTLPVLSGVLLQFDGTDDTLRVSGTNLEIGLQASCPVVPTLDATPFQAVPLARLLLEYVKSIRDDTVLLTYEEKKSPALVKSSNRYVQTGTLVLKAGRTQTAFDCMAGEDFPQLPNRLTMETVLQLPVSTLRDLIENTAYAAATDESRPILTGVNVAERGGRIHAAATDGFRLGYVSRNGQVGSLKLALTIPARALTNLRRLLGDDDDLVTLYLAHNRNAVAFTVGDTVLVAQLVEGNYPDFHQILPKSYATDAVVSRSALMGAFRQAHLFAKNDKDIIRLTLTPGVNGEPGSIGVSGESASFGKTDALVEAAVTGPPLQIAVNGAYALQTLALLKTDKARARFGTPASPIALSPCSDEGAESSDDIHLIMPMHIGR